MISVGQITNAGGAASYYTEEQDRLEYYQGEKSPSEWKGAGAKISGIDGEEVTREGMEAMLSGKVREIGESGFIEERQLGRIRADQETGEKKLEHRAGWDFTFSAPKSVSIEAEVFGRSDVLVAHREAVDKAMGYLERHAQARIDGKTENTGNLTYAQFEHATTRAGDPQAHTHVVVANLTYGENGKAYSLESKGMYEARHAADNVYKNELARSLQEKGYQVEWNNTGDFEIKGYAREQIEAFSKRSEEIKEELAERGVTKAEASAQERQIAALDSRQAKNHPESREAHQERWLKEADEIGIKPAERAQEGGEKANGKEAAREAVGKAMSHITEREAAFKESELYKEAARFSQGGASLEELDRAVRDAKASGGLMDRGDGKFTTREMTTLENGVGKRIEEGKGAHQRVMDKAEFERALKDFEARKSKEKGQSFKLSEEQRGAAGMILTGNDRFQGVQGLAGTGKTTMLEFVREAAEKKGWEVKGFSNGAAQAQKLQEESGIGSQTTRSFLNERRSGAQAARKDAELARGALATYEGRTVSARKLEKIAADPATKKEWDSKGRVYLRAKDGRVYQPALHSGKRSIESRNLNHAGLTKTRYVIGEKGVFKQGGTLKSELAGKINDRIQAGIRRDYHKGLDRVRADVAKSGGRAGPGRSCGPSVTASSGRCGRT
ncbi:conjugative relaxase domain protein [Acidithiobacillus sp. GGI-221]|nr:conjugative relaxase domain protein [Acidithiobacillus sp. GGI-221]